MHYSFTPARGLYSSYFGQPPQPEAIAEIKVNASECKILEGDPSLLAAKERHVTQWVCECGRSDAFKIFARSLTTVAKCCACQNEKVIHEG